MLVLHFLYKEAVHFSVPVSEKRKAKLLGGVFFFPFYNALFFTKLQETAKEAA